VGRMPDLTYPDTPFIVNMRRIANEAFKEQYYYYGEIRP
jgi:hypothetical protein